MTPYIFPRRSAPSLLTEDKIADLLKRFLHDHEIVHGPEPLCDTNAKLETLMRNQIEEKGFPHQMARIIHLAASLIELAYPNCTFEEKTNIALYNWYLIFIDDACSKDDISPYLAFEERFLAGLPQLHPVLEALTQVLRRMFKLYPPFFANGIVSATFEFISGTCIEPAMEELQHRHQGGAGRLRSSSTRFPWFLRKQTGVAVAFALMLYPKSQHFDYTVCYQGLADMDFWISAANDLLSLYKETMAGETANYISNRARAEDKTLSDVVTDLVDELAASRSHVYSIFELSPSNSNSATIWRAWEYGYIVWHLTQKRYKLGDLGF